jgi:hypothetical protein
MQSVVSELALILLINIDVRACIDVRNRREQRPSNKGNLDSIVTGKIGRVYRKEVNLLLSLFFFRSNFFTVRF